jgi:NADH:ubiquinone oxidoreductase subunit B-like Fe-S oxidoreductase
MLQDSRQEAEVPLSVGAIRNRLGCPPTAEQLLYGILQLQNKIARSQFIAR